MPKPHAFPSSQIRASRAIVTRASVLVPSDGSIRSAPASSFFLAGVSSDVFGSDGADASPAAVVSTASFPLVTLASAARSRMSADPRRFAIFSRAQRKRTSTRATSSRYDSSKIWNPAGVRNCTPDTPQSVVQRFPARRRTRCPSSTLIRPPGGSPRTESARTSSLSRQSLVVFRFELS